MSNFFRLDGPFFKYGTLLADIIILTLLWHFCSIAIITIGASTTAVYYVTTRMISNNESYITKDFFKSFIGNFIQSTIAFIIIAALLGIIAFDIRALSAFGGMWLLFVTLQLIIGAEIVMSSIYIFPLIARFDMKLIDIFKTAFFMANKHIFTTITCLALLIATVCLVLFLYQFALIFAVGAYAYITSFMLLRIFKKYNSNIQ